MKEGKGASTGLFKRYVSRLGGPVEERKKGGASCGLGLGKLLVRSEHLTRLPLSPLSTEIGTISWKGKERETRFALVLGRCATKRTHTLYPRSYRMEFTGGWRNESPLCNYSPRAECDRERGTVRLV